MECERNQLAVQKKSPGSALIESLGGLRDALRDGECLHEKFTMRTVELVLEPREFTPEEVLRIRENLRASQGVFAKLLGVSIKTLQAWEQGKNPPPPIARRLLDRIEADPEPWFKMLRDGAVSVPA